MSKSDNEGKRFVDSRVSVSVWVCRLDGKGWFDEPEKLSGELPLISGTTIKEGVVRLFSGFSGGVVISVGVHGGVIAMLDEQGVCRLHLDHTDGDLGSAMVAAIEHEAAERLNSW